MRAAFAIPGDLTRLSGGYGYARRLLREAPKLGLHLEIVPLPGGFPAPNAGELAEARQSLSEVPANTPLIIDGLAYGALPTDVIASIRAPIVALCHHPLALETGLTKDEAAHLCQTERAALASARAVITTSRATAEILRKDFAVPPEKLAIAAPGTDAAPRATGSCGKSCRILSVGSITPRKGHIRVIEALARIDPEMWSLSIVGPSPNADYLSEVEAAIEHHGLSGKIALRGPLSISAVTSAYQTADLFVLASEFEGFGMAFAEAMAHGLPVLGLASFAVSEATLGAAELVSAEQFSENLERLVRDAELRAALADRCWEASGRLPRWPDTASIVADLLAEVA
ncbi:MAG: glycosyltransferase family 4 protein [Pseudomonadota bacterium]